MMCALKVSGNIVAGNRALESIPYELGKLHVNSPLIITDKGVSDAGLIRTLIKSFRDSEVIIGAVYDETATRTLKRGTSNKLIIP